MFNSQGQRLNSFGQPFTGRKVYSTGKHRLMGSAGGGGLDEFHANNPDLPNNFSRPFGPEQQVPQTTPQDMESLFPGIPSQQPESSWNPFQDQSSGWNPYAQQQQQTRLNAFGEPFRGNKIRGVQRRRDLSGNIIE